MIRGAAPGDRVEVLDGPHRGKLGTVHHRDLHGRCLVELDNVKVDRIFWAHELKRVTL